MDSVLNLLFLRLDRLLLAVVLDRFAVPLTGICRRLDRATDVRRSLGIQGRTDEAKIAGRDREQAGFDGVDGAVDDSVDRIDDLVNE